MTARVLMYGKPGCHLCELAEETIAAVCAETGDGYEVVDITGDARLMAEHGEHVPVTFVDGRQHDFWRVDPARLQAALRA
ncbi:glutaredoxin family protein [Aeromicrobium sp. IC_218]|uniref:glutaredoxin family protein n=1 Tax=Aeromicrobium sp. IC_218 TaxID=2545468 RepID=UPI001F61249E|nr:glutaredoxin family protein [Aeromicrobium sp. IC_218]